MNTPRPTSLFSEFSSVAEKVENEPIEEELEALIVLSKTEGWGYLSQYIQNLIDEINTLFRMAVENGAGYEEMGQKAVIKEITTEYLSRILEKVNDAKTTGDKLPR